MTKDVLMKKLNELRRLPAETEIFEFKEAKSNFPFDKLGNYFSALSNEANLKGKAYAWLIFGIKDKGKTIVGSYFRPNRKDLDSLKGEIANKTTNRITFIEIHELQLQEGRVIMFQIPAAPKGIPISFDGHYYGRDGEELSPLNIEEFERIRAQAIIEDWSAVVISDATIEDLDPAAIQKARENFKKKFPAQMSSVDSWDDTTFLNKAKITIQGKITRAAIILLGMNESEHFLSPSVGRISWFLRDGNNIEKDYEHFGPPFILNIDAVYSKIRNLTYRYLPDNTLFPVEVLQYEPYVIREALNNCVAHQDYELSGRINVVEKPEELLFTNLGKFLPGSIEKVIEQDAPPEYYRNALLAHAMVNLNLIDTQGGGIKKMFLFQMNRYFPLPDYDLSEPEKVRVRITGKIIDENYTKLLTNRTDLDIGTVIILDRVQKGITITREDATKLRKEKLIEGRYPNLFVSAKVASITGHQVEYTGNKGLDKQYYQDMVLQLLKQCKGGATRQQIDTLLINKLPNILTAKQKQSKIHNLLYEMSCKKGLIGNIGNKKKPLWVPLNK